MKGDEKINLVDNKGLKLQSLATRLGICLQGEEPTIMDCLEILAAFAMLPLGIGAWSILGYRIITRGNTVTTVEANIEAARRTAANSSHGIENRLRLMVHRNVVGREMEKLGRVDHGKWLDIATGAGDLFLVGKENYGLKVGIDRFPFSGKAIAERACDAGFVQADACALPFRTASMDLVTCLFFLHHLDNPLPCLEEARRVLAEHGNLMLLTVNPIYGYRLLLNMGLTVASPSGDRKMYSAGQVERLCLHAGLNVVKILRPPMFSMFLCKRA
ncbi:MAG: methyltransferase domain-containing protein [Deltaproteobacteria bacterium]|nr:methyltransferase domain-containing protein [Deltaproteobacteria bacterium]